MCSCAALRMLRTHCLQMSEGLDIRTPEWAARGGGLLVAREDGLRGPHEGSCLEQIPDCQLRQCAVREDLPQDVPCTVGLYQRCCGPARVRDVKCPVSKGRMECISVPLHGSIPRVGAEEGTLCHAPDLEGLRVAVKADIFSLVTAQVSQVIGDEVATVPPVCLNPHNVHPIPPAPDRQQSLPQDVLMVFVAHEGAEVRAGPAPENVDC
mmetsp:Transcript_8053/g.16042  ORF Transcript_8053/g.16042 Transcript_8053/m.16042 type:complete len:209 (+) Transcript_8053:727-1353(+)